MYPYHLGVHLKTGQLCRIPHPDWGCGIPQGFARVIWFKEQYESNRRINPMNIPYFKRTPYDRKGELLNQYWSLQRWTDIQHRLGEPRTGPNMLQLFISGV